MNPTNLFMSADVEPHDVGGEIRALVRPARVIPPVETAAMAAAVRGVASAMYGWAVGIILPNWALSALHEAEPVSEALSIGQSSAGLAVVCHTLQVGTTQLRTLLNGNEATTKGWMTQLLMAQTSQWCVTLEGSDQWHWTYRQSAAPDPASLLLSLYHSAHLRPEQEASEMAEVCARYAAVPAVPSLQPERPVRTLIVGVQTQPGQGEGWSGLQAAEDVLGLPVSSGASLPPLH